jgi:hypothetical protein
MTKYQEFARANHTPGAEINDLWHPLIQVECQVMNQEEFERKEAERKQREEERARIREVISKTADISADLTGRIVVKVSFEGSHAKTKRLTASERALVISQPYNVKGVIGAEKPLFESEAYDDLMNFISERRNDFASYGIPHIHFASSHVVDVMRIPEIEDLSARTEKQLAEKVEAFAADWPRAIEAAKERLGPLFKAEDYKPVEAIRSLFKFKYDWMAFGVPDQLKQFDIKIYERACAKAEKAWKQIEANGVLLLRETIMELVGGLSDALTPKENGDKKRFYASNVTKIQQFVEDFKKRNICNDALLEAEVEKLNSIVSDIDTKALSSDDALRSSVKAKMDATKEVLSELVIDANSRRITFEE